MRIAALGCVFLALGGIAGATTTYIANGTSSGGNTISAEADFTFSNNLLTLTITNLLVNPTSVGQNITDFEFTIGSLSGTTPTLTPYTGSSTNTIAPTLVTISGPGYSTNNNGGAGYDPGWAFAYSSGNFSLNGLAGSANGPAYSIVGAPGAGGYTAANGSLTSSPHNPMIYQTATWVFNIANSGGTALPITHIVFSFNTTAGDIFACDLNGGCLATPEPGSLLLLGTGLAGVALVAFRTARRKRA